MIEEGDGVLDWVAVAFVVVALGTADDPDEAADMADDVLLALVRVDVVSLVIEDCAKTCACIRAHRATRDRRNRRISHPSQSKR